MQALSLGLVAALAWGVHDICVRHVSQRTGVLAALCAVLVIGSALLLPAALLIGGWGRMTGAAWSLSLAAGAAYAMGGLGLYRSFAIGPVRLVAPIVAAYPILSVAWAAASGRPVAAAEWLAVLAIVAGVSLVAALSEAEGDASRARARAILWAAIGSAGFGLTFAFGQAAAQAGAELPVTFVTRLAAVAGVVALALGCAEGLRPSRRQLPLLAAMGALDALAVSMVIAAGTLPHPEYAAVTASVFGMVTILLAWAFLKEPMSPAQWAGVGVVFAGVAYLAS